MQGLHLTGDLFDCSCNANVLTDLETLSKLCRDATLASGLTIVDEKYHVFPEWQGQPGGITGAVLLAESHLAIHTWPERRGVTLDVYVCNFTSDNTAKAEQLFNALLVAFRPGNRIVNRLQRGDLQQAAAPAPAADDAAPKHAGEHVIFEWLNGHSGYGYTASRQIAVQQSPYQRIEVYDTPQFGKLFRLDGRMMTSEREEFFYHECMTHPAALAHPNPQSVLVIGGGDGGSSEELLKHPSVKRIVMAELDPMVIETSRQHFQAIHKGALDDPRLEIRVGDGYEYVRECVEKGTEKFDLIVLDLTDPDTPAFHLYSEEFFRLCQRALNPGGLMTMHLGTPVFQPEVVRKNARNLRNVFRHVNVMALYIPLYGSLWCLGVASDSVNARALTAEQVAARLAERRIGGLSYYNPEVHGALFSLPTFVRDLTEPQGQDRARVLRVA